MSEYITLLGAEEVSRAATRMQAAAGEMTNAANQISASLEEHRRSMEQLLDSWTLFMTDQPAGKE